MKIIVQLEELPFDMAQNWKAFGAQFTEAIQIVLELDRAKMVAKQIERLPHVSSVSISNDDAPHISEGGVQPYPVIEESTGKRVGTLRDGKIYVDTGAPDFKE